MKHLAPITTATPPKKADAYSDFFNAINRAWIDFRVAKKNEYSF
jgi:hypothetical protein